MRLKTLLLLGSAALAWKMASDRSRTGAAYDRRQDSLDEALDETFPASDPPSASNPTAPISSREFDRGI